MSPRADPDALRWVRTAESQTVAVQDHLDEVGADWAKVKLRCPQQNQHGQRCLRVIALLAPHGSNGAVMPVHYAPAYMENAEWPLTEEGRAGATLGPSPCDIPGCPNLTHGLFCPVHASGKEYEPRAASGWGLRVRIWCPRRKCPYERTVTMARLAQLFVVAVTADSPQMWVE